MGGSRDLLGDPFSQGVGRVLAPALGAFVRWVLGRALEEGVSRLYFVARDGWFPWRLAQGLCRAWELPLECRYLYGSRLAWRQPLFCLDHRRALGQLCGGRGGLTLGRILLRGGFSPQEAARLAPRLGLAPERPLSRRELRELPSRLEACQGFFPLLDRLSREALALAEGYLRQEGLWDPVPWALVDSGWMGSLQESLSALLDALGWKGELSGFYWGLYRAPRAGRWECFYFRPGRDVRRQGTFEPCLFEAVFTAPEGTVLGYRRKGGSFLPRLEGGPPPSEAWAREEEIFRRYGEHLARRPRPLGDRREAGKLQPGLGALMARPTRGEAAAFGALPFSDGPAGEGSLPLAAPLSREELKGGLLLSRALTGRGAPPSAWLPGSAALAGEEGLFPALDRLRRARVLALAARAWAL